MSGEVIQMDWMCVCVCVCVCVSMCMCVCSYSIQTQKTKGIIEYVLKDILPFLMTRSRAQSCVKMCYRDPPIPSRPFPSFPHPFTSQSITADVHTPFFIHKYITKHARKK